MIPLIIEPPFPSISSLFSATYKYYCPICFQVTLISHINSKLDKIFLQSVTLNTTIFLSCKQDCGSSIFFVQIFVKPTHPPKSERCSYFKSKTKNLTIPYCTMLFNELSQFDIKGFLYYGCYVRK